MYQFKMSVFGTSARTPNALNILYMTYPFQTLNLPMLFTIVYCQKNVSFVISD